MSNPVDKQVNDNSDAITLRQISAHFRQVVKYLRSKWMVILIAALVGAVAGLGLAIFKKTTYSAVCSFVLDAGDKDAMLGQYAGLASLAGVSLDGGGGLFQGDNILELYKSRTMIEKALLSTGDFDGKKQMLIDRYIQSYHLLEKWKDKDHINSINFNGDPAKFNRKQDSIISDLVKTFNKKYLSVSKPDKKLAIIVVEVKSYDELFAKHFVEKIVDNVNTFFVQTKTKKMSQNVQVLQHQADSVRAILNSSISGVASAADAAPNANPLMQSLRVPSQRKQVDVQANTAIYGELIKNLEIAKVSLRKETPLIQLIDTPTLPLEDNKITKIKGMLIGLVLGGVLTAIWLSLKHFLGEALQ